MRTLFFSLLFCSMMVPCTARGQVPNKGRLTPDITWLEWHLKADVIPKYRIPKWIKNRKDHLKKYNQSPAHVRAVRALRFRIQHSRIKGVYVGSVRNKVRVCIHGPTRVLPELQKKKKSWTLHRLQQFLTAQGALGFHMVRDEISDAQKIFSQMSQRLPVGVKSHVRFYIRSHQAKTSGVDRFFVGPRNTLTSWLSVWNKILKDGYTKGIYSSHYKIVLLMSQYYKKNKFWLQWRTLLVSNKPSITSIKFKSFQPFYDKSSRRYRVRISFDPSGSDLLEYLTQELVGYRFAITIGNTALVAPVIQKKMSGGRLELSMGNLKTKKESLEEAKGLSLFMETALPTPVKLVKQTIHRSKNSSFCQRLARQKPLKIVVIKQGIRKRLSGAFRSFFGRFRKWRNCVAVINKKHCIAKSVFAMQWKKYAYDMRIPIYTRSIYQKRRILLLRKRLLQSMIDNVLYGEAAKLASISLTKRSVQRALNQNRRFQVDGSFSKDLYQRILMSYGVSDKLYRALIRTSLLVDRYRKSIKSSIKISAQDVWKHFKRRKLKVKLAFLRVPLKRFNVPVPAPTKQEFRQFLQQKKHLVRKYYQNNLNKFVSVKQVRARHILIYVRSNASSAKKAEALAKIRMIRDKALTQPKSFARLAMALSEGPSKVRGGDLGYFKARAMVSSFSRAAFRLRRIGEISPVVLTRFGYHIIQLTGVKPEQRITLQSAEPLIAKLLWSQIKREIVLKNTLQWVKKRWRRLGSRNQLIKELKQRATKSKSNPPAPSVAIIKALVSALDNDVTLSFPITSKFIPPMKSRLPQVRLLAKKAFELTKSRPFLEKSMKIGDSIYVFKLKRRTKLSLLRRRFAREKKTYQRYLIKLRYARRMDSIKKQLRKRAKIQIKYSVLKKAISN